MLDDIIQFISSNWAILFSGAGGLIVIWLLNLLFRKKRAGLSQKIRSGDNSNNVQVGGNVTIKGDSKTDGDKES